MTDPLSASDCLRLAQARQRAFVSLYRLVLIVEALLGLALLVVPRLLPPVVALPLAAGDRLWGATLLFGVLLQVPALLSPVHERLTVIASVAGRGLLAIVYLLLALWLPALATAAAAAALAALFTRLVYAEIGSKP